jgi:hypothetical protein
LFFLFAASQRLREKGDERLEKLMEERRLLLLLDPVMSVPSTPVVVTVW